MHWDQEAPTERRDKGIPRRKVMDKSGEQQHDNEDGRGLERSRADQSRRQILGKKKNGTTKSVT